MAAQDWPFGSSNDWPLGEPYWHEPQPRRPQVNGELMPYNHGAPVPRDDRAMAARAKEIYDDTRLTRLAIDARQTLADHYMEQATDLDTGRRSLALLDPPAAEVAPAPPPPGRYGAPGGSLHPPAPKTAKKKRKKNKPLVSRSNWTYAPARVTPAPMRFDRIRKHGHLTVAEGPDGSLHVLENGPHTFVVDDVVAFPEAIQSIQRAGFKPVYKSRADGEYEVSFEISPGELSRERRLRDLVPGRVRPGYTAGYHPVSGERARRAGELPSASARARSAPTAQGSASRRPSLGPKPGRVVPLGQQAGQPPGINARPDRVSQDADRLGRSAGPAVQFPV